VRHLGVLARIQLDEHEVQRLTGQLSAIVDNIAKVSEVATPDVPRRATRSRSRTSSVPTSSARC
jgi:Asp-tRNA(Asn)/Glu-tRNA(Gln) amidotransferase C subunit